MNHFEYRNGTRSNRRKRPARARLQRGSRSEDFSSEHKMGFAGRISSGVVTRASGPSTRTEKSKEQFVQSLYAFLCTCRAFWFKRKPRTPSGGNMKRCQ